MSHKIDVELEKIMEWVESQLTKEDLPPWSWYSYMKLQEAVTDVMKGHSVKTENLQQSGKHSGSFLRLVDETYQKDISQPRPDTDEVHLPM